MLYWLRHIYRFLVRVFVAHPLEALFFRSGELAPMWIKDLSLEHIFLRQDVSSSEFVKTIVSLPRAYDDLVVAFRYRAIARAGNAGEVEQIEERIRRIRNERALAQFVSPRALFANTNTHCYLDTWIKAAILDGRHSPVAKNPMPMTSVLLRQLPATSYEIWAEYLQPVGKTKFLKEYGGSVLNLLHDPAWAVEFRGQMHYVEFAKSLVNSEWERVFGSRVLPRRTKDHDRARGILADLGLPRNAWFVTLHVRDAGAKTGSWRNDEPIDGWRNADIETYRAAIELVRGQGGYVVRVGDPAMKPLHNESNLINYWSSEVRDRQLDYYLFTECELFVGTASGPILSSVMCRVPTIGTNFFPFHARLHASNTTTLPKKYREIDSGRVLSAMECLSIDQDVGLGPVAPQKLQRLGIEVVNNEDLEIADAVAEHLGLVSPTPHVKHLRMQIDLEYQTNSRYGAMGKIGGLWLENLDREGKI